MKEFAKEKKHSTEPKAQDSAPPQTQRRGGAGATDLMSAARAGDPAAIKMLQSAGNRAIDAAFGPEAEKKSLGRLAEVNPAVAVKLARSTGKDVGDAEVKVEPELEASGKRGVAREGREIGVGSESAARDARLMAHEAAHVVQQRGGSEKGEGTVGEPEGAQGASNLQGAAGPQGASDPQAAAQANASVGGGASAPTGMADAEQEVVAAEDKLLVGEPVGLRASGAGELFEEALEEPCVEGVVNGTAAGGLEMQAEVDANTLESAQKHKLQSTAMGWIASIVGAPSSTVDEDFVRATMKWQDAHGLEGKGILDEGTLDKMGPELLNQFGKGTAAQKWYAETGSSLYAQSSKLAKKPRDNGPQFDEPSAEPIATILDELRLSPSEAFENPSDVSKYDPKKKLQVTDKLLERALLWQINAKLGLVLDAELGASALVYMGIDPGTKQPDDKAKEMYNIWNVDNMEKQEVDQLTDGITKDGTFMGGVVNTISVGGTEKRAGDVTGDDQIAWGIAHFTKTTELAAFLEFVSSFDDHKDSDGAGAMKEPSEGDSSPKGLLAIEASFGSRDVEAVKAELLLDKTWPDINNTYLAALAQLHALDKLLGFFRDETVKYAQVEHLRGKVESDIDNSDYGGKFKEGGHLTVGSAALVACLANSSSHGLGDVEREGKSLKERQVEAGELYLAGGDEKLGYLKVAKYVWQEQYGEKGKAKTHYSREEWTKLAATLMKDNKLTTDERDEAIEAKGPQHRLRRLLNVLKNFGPNWKDSYTGTKGGL